MADKIKVALLQSDQATYMPALRLELRAQSAVVQLIESCKDLSTLLSAPEPPDVILTDLTASDGTWEDVVRIGQNAAVPVNVIVVSRHSNIRLYIEALEKGAFDFIIPPFETAQLLHVLRSAFWNVAKQREARARAPLLRGSEPTRPLLAVAS